MKICANVHDSFHFMNTFSLGKMDKDLEKIFTLKKRKYSFDSKIHFNQKPLNAEEKIKILKKRFSIVNSLKRKLKNKSAKQRKLISNINKNNLMKKRRTNFSQYCTKKNSININQKIKSQIQERKQSVSEAEKIKKPRKFLPIFPSKIVQLGDSSEPNYSNNIDTSLDMLQIKSKIINRPLIRRFSLINPEKLSIFSEKNKLNFITKLNKYYQGSTKRNRIR